MQVVRVYYFTSEARRMFETAIRQGEAAGVDGFIIDMRNNPGNSKKNALLLMACAREGLLGTVVFVPVYVFPP